jgi:hypothetical protein
MQCKQAFDNKNMGYMDKTVFYRIRVVGGPGVAGTTVRTDDAAGAGAGGQQGFLLEPCRGDNLNMWFENELADLDVGLALHGNSEPIVASSTFTNCGESVGSSGVGLFNSLITVGVCCSCLD